MGLAAILEDVFGVQLDKRMQRTNWGQRPLSATQLDYARLDTHFLLALRQRQEEELRARGRWEEAEEVFTGLLDIAWEERESNGFWRLPGVYDLQPQQQAVLYGLYQWRENKAEQRDIPPFRVLRNEALMELAVVQPARAVELQFLKDIPHSLPPRVARELLEVIAGARSSRPPQPPERNNGHRPDDAVLACYDRLRAWRTETARRRGVDPDVVLTNRLLMAIARANPADRAELAATNLLGPWRLHTYGDDILRACAGNPSSIHLCD